MTGPMKIISYNLLEGARETGDELVEFISGHAPDVVCLQEANGWDEEGQRRAREFAERVDLPYYVLGRSNTPFHLVTYSRTPFTESAVHTDGFWHSAVRVVVPFADDVLHVWNLHLYPFDEAGRLEETERVLSLMADEASARPDRRIVAMGDLNSLSAVDEYPTDLVADLRGKGVTKFGDAALRTDVMTRFTGGGLVDVAHALGTNEWTVPTPVNTDADHADRLRLDYLLADEGTARLVTSAVVARDGRTDRISDHYPLVITLG